MDFSLLIKHPMVEFECGVSRTSLTLRIEVLPFVSPNSNKKVIIVLGV